MLVCVYAYFLDFIDDFAFEVALVVVDAYFGESLAQFFQIVCPCSLAVYFGFANAQEVQIWAVYDLDSHNFVVLLLFESLSCRYKDIK